VWLWIILWDGTTIGMWSVVISVMFSLAALLVAHWRFSEAALHVISFSLTKIWVSSNLEVPYRSLPACPLPWVSSRSLHWVVQRTQTCFSELSKDTGLFRLCLVKNRDIENRKVLHLLGRSKWTPSCSSCSFTSHVLGLFTSGSMFFTKTSKDE